jgi:capsular exopolysaccharide synthesis family protein
MTYLQGLTNQVAGLDQVGRGFGRALDSLPRKEMNTARLGRDARLLQEMYALVQTRLKEAEITQGTQDPTVRLVDPAVAAGRPLRPRPVLNIALSLVLGAILGLCVALGREMVDRSVRSRADVIQAAGLPVLGAIPRVEPPLARSLRGLAWRRKRHALGPRPDHSMVADENGASRAAARIAARLITRLDASRAFSESFNQLHANLALSHQEKPIKVVVFTSALPGEGKTLSAINFALTAAARGLSVLLIDADLRCGVVNEVFRCARRPGFHEVLAGSARFDDGARAIPVGESGTLVVLPTGEFIHGPSRVFQVERLRAVLLGLSPRYDLIVIDSPPVNLLADAALLGAAADGVIIVVRAGKTDAEALRFAMDQLTAARAPLIGTLLNDIDLRRYAHDDGAYRYLKAAEKYHGERV